MAQEQKARPSREKVREHRARMRAQGLKPIVIWVPDVNAPGFAEEVHRQCLRVANSPQEADDLAFVASIATSAWPDEAEEQ